MLQKCILITWLASVLTVELAVADNALDLEFKLVDLAKYTCATEIKEGVDYDITAMADGSVELKLLGKKGGNLDGSFVFSKEEWVGQQKVLIEDRPQLQSEFQGCVVNQTDKLRETHVDSSSECENFSGTWKSIDLPAEQAETMELTQSDCHIRGSISGVAIHNVKGEVVSKKMSMDIERVLDGCLNILRAVSKRHPDNNKRIVRTITEIIGSCPPIVPSLQLPVVTYEKF